MKSKIKVGIVSLFMILGVLFSAFPTHGFEGSQSTPVTSNIPVSSFVPSKEGYKFRGLSTLEMTTERLILAPTVDEDFDKLSEYLLDKDVTQYLDPSPTVKKGFETKEEAFHFLKSEGSSEISNTLEFTIKLKEDNLPIGKLDLMLCEKSTVMVGYWLGKEFQGKGYMSEASFELCNKAFLASDIKILYIACDVENKGSAHLAVKISDYIERSNEDMNLICKTGVYNTHVTFEDEEVSFDYFQLTLDKQ